MASEPQRSFCLSFPKDGIIGASLYVCAKTPNSAPVLAQQVIYLSTVFQILAHVHFIDSPPLTLLSDENQAHTCTDALGMLSLALLS